MKRLILIGLAIMLCILPVHAATVTYHHEGGLPDVWMTNYTWYTETELCSSLGECNAYCTGRSAITPLYGGSAILSRTKSYINSSGWYVPSGTDTAISHCIDSHSGCSYTYNSANVSSVMHLVSCKNTGGTIVDSYLWRTLSRTYPELLVNFTGSPTEGVPALTVSFVVSNATGMSSPSKYWSFGDGATTTTTTNTINHTYLNQGNYTVRMEYYDGSGVLSSIQKNDYITVGAPNATKTKWFQTIDGTNGNIVLNSSIQLNDIENSSWVNATGLSSDGMSSITTLEGHHINAYAQALGFSDSDDLNILNDGQPRYIMMWPTFAKNVSAGNVSLYVTVKDKDTKANIKGAGVTMSPSSGSAQSTTTNEAGIAYFVVKNSTMVLITAQAIGQGYQTATTTINTGINSGGSASAAATILLGKNTVTPTFPTVTTLPGGGTPTATVTILPGCEDQISEEGQAKCRRAQSNQGLSFLSAHMMDLIMICVFVTMLYLLGFKLGK